VVKQPSKYVSERELATLLGVSKTAVGEWKDAGEFQLDENGRILREEALEAGKLCVARIADRKTATVEAAKINSEFIAARRDKERAIADLRRVEADLAAGRYVKLADVESDGRETAERILGVLRQIAQRVARDLECPCRPAAVVEARIREEVERAVAEMKDSVWLRPA
jgi:hypothetical protein